MSGQDTPRALSIRELPRSERPRERLVDLGAQALSSAELLAILLGSGGLGRTALQLGQSVLAGSGGSLRRIAMQPVAALTTLTGVGTARAVTVHAALELGRRMAAESREDGAPVRSPRDVVELFAARLEDLPVEEHQPQRGDQRQDRAPGSVGRLERLRARRLPRRPRAHRRRARLDRGRSNECAPGDRRRGTYF